MSIEWQTQGQQTDPGRDIVAKALRNPKAALHELERIRCEESLLDFVKAAWHALHPATPFVSGWAVETMARHLEAVTRGDIDRLLINVPPGCTKSMLVNVFWPLWEWGPKQRPHEQYISASYNLDLSKRDLSKAREIMRTEWFQSHWPIVNKKDKDATESYENTNTGWRKATSVGGGLTGWRGTRFLIDDPHSTKTAESDLERLTCRFWMAEAVPTRFTDQNRPVYVVIMQRLHETDLSGMIINELSEGQDWVHLCLPMEAELKFKSWTPVPNGTTPQRMRRVKEDGEPLPFFVPDPEGELLYCQDPRQTEGELLWEKRFSRKAVEELKVSFRSVGGTYAESCQLQQRPVPRGGGMFNKADVHFVQTIPNGGEWCRGWDLAATKDGQAAYTVGLKMGIVDGRVYIGDVIRFRGSPTEVEEEIKRAAQMDGNSCMQSLPQDPGQSGKSQKQALARLLHGHDFHFSTESGSKEDRARPLAAQCGAGNLHVLSSSWAGAFMAELGLFPGSTFLDQIDAASRAYSWLIQENDGDVACVAPKEIR